MGFSFNRISDFFVVIVVQEVLHERGFSELRASPRTPQDMDGRLKGIFSKLETSRNMKK